MQTAAPSQPSPRERPGSGIRPSESRAPEGGGSPASICRIATRLRRHKLILPSVIFSIAAGLVLALSCPAAEPPNLEYPVKAAFLYNFAKFVQWPAQKFPQPDSPLIIGIVGADPFGTTLDDLVENEIVRKGKRIDGRRLVIRRFGPEEDFKQCHLLFISRSLKDSFGQILAALKSESILTVSEIDKFSQRGGMLSLNVVDNTLKSELNLDTVERTGLKISSRLSSVVRVLRSENAERH